jgi:hypothetical protein
MIYYTAYLVPKGSLHRLQPLWVLTLSYWEQSSPSQSVALYVRGRLRGWVRPGEHARRERKREGKERGGGGGVRNEEGESVSE